MTSGKNYKSILLYFLMVVCGIIGAFFIFYTARLLYITQGLSNIRVGGKGTYIGAVVFPILSLTFCFFSWRLYKTIRKINE
jgi:hypothetical protein